MKRNKTGFSNNSSRSMSSPSFIEFGQPLFLRSDTLSQSGPLNLFTDRVAILRCGGRLSHEDLPYSAKRILFDANHGFTTLVIRNCHESVMHDGVKETLTEVRSKFWLARGRQVVKKLLHSCVTCRRHDGKPYQAPPPPPLLEFRVKSNFQ